MKKRIIIISLIIVELIMVNLTCQSFFYRKITPEEHNQSRRQFAMFVNDGKGYTEYKGESLFPKGYYLNRNLSYCENINGDRYNDVISSYNNSITITSNKTLYCTLYFEKANSTILTYNNEKSGTTCGTVQCALDELYTLLK